MSSAAKQGAPVRKTEPHWYAQVIGECPVCGKDDSYRLRCAGPKPEDPADRYWYLPDTITYCGCLEG